MSIYVIICMKSQIHFFIGGEGGGGGVVGDNINI